MTYKEYMLNTNPRFVCSDYVGGVSGCPYDCIEYATKPDYCDEGVHAPLCDKCWNREMEEVEVSPDEDTSYEFVEHPSHYNKPGEKETWEKMCDIWGPEKMATWSLQTAFKYADRIGEKPGEDVKREADKIKTYIAKSIEFSERAKNDIH